MNTWYIVLFVLAISLLFMTWMISVLQKKWINLNYEYIDQRTQKIDVAEVIEILDEDSSYDVNDQIEIL